MRLDDGLDKVSNMERLKQESINRVKRKISTLSEPSSKPSKQFKTEKKKEIDTANRIKEQIEHKNR